MQSGLRIRAWHQEPLSLTHCRASPKRQAEKSRQELSGLRALQARGLQGQEDLSRLRGRPGPPARSEARQDRQITEPGERLTETEAVLREAAAEPVGAVTEAVEPVTAEIVTETVEAVMAGIAEEAVTVNAEPALEETETETAEPALEETETETVEPALEETGTETAEPALEETGTETAEPALEETGTETVEPALEEIETETAEPAALAGIVTETVVQAALAEGPEVVLPVPDSGIPVLRALIPRFSQSPPAAVRTTTIITKTNVMIKRM